MAGWPVNWASAPFPVGGGPWFLAARGGPAFFDTRDHALYHVMEAHRSTAAELCYTCARSFPLAEFAAHMRTHGPLYTQSLCYDCGMTFVLHSEAERHRPLCLRPQAEVECVRGATASLRLRRREIAGMAPPVFPGPEPVADAAIPGMPASASAPAPDPMELELPPASRAPMRACAPARASKRRAADPGFYRELSGRRARATLH